MNVLAVTFAGRNFRHFLDFFSFLAKASATSVQHFLEGNCAFTWKTKLYVIYHNVIHALRLETSKTFFCEFFIPLGPDIKVFIGILLKTPENTFQFLKCQGIKNYF